MKYSKEKNTGITLIALVVTIIILLILAGVTIATLTGDNGLLQKASTAKQTSKEAEIKEKIILVVNSARMKNMSLLDRTILEDELKNEFGEGNYELLLVGESFLISVNKIEYFVEKDGKVSDGNKVEESNIKYAGDLSKGGQYNGDTEETAYRITCIEDLVEWSNNYNNYKNKNIKLEKTIDFNSTASYNNPRAKTTDINENGKIEELITELTTGAGFKPITNYRGTFNGQNNEIRNIYENTNTNAGLFKQTDSNAKICNLGVTGKIIATGTYAGGVLAMSTSITTIEQCNFKGTIKGSAQYVGGIIGYTYNSKIIINKCYNLGNIETDNSIGEVGGIIGRGLCNPIYNCYNFGNVHGRNAGGIVGWTAMGKVIRNCYNVGNIEAINLSGENVGGILGYTYGSIDIENSFNVGSLTANIVGGILGLGLWSGCVQSLNNNYYLEDTSSKGSNNVGSDLPLRCSKVYMQSQEFVDELNIYVNTYNEEHKNDEDFVSLKRWKYNQGDYPSFE